MIQDFIVNLRSSIMGESSTADVGRVLIPIVLLIVVIAAIAIVLYALYLRTPRGRVEALFEDRAVRSDTSRWPTRIVIGAAILIAIAVPAYQMQRPSQCAKCHTEVNYTKTLAASPHQGVNCLACHGQTGVAAPAANTAQYVRWIFVYASTQKAPEQQGSVVSSSACIACHQSVLSEVATSNGIRVRHSDFLDKGAQCRDCHNSVAHGDSVIKPTSPQMNDCIVCHDGSTASSECDYCHVEDVAISSARSSSLPKVQNLDTGNCYICHDEKPCLQCHGVSMPHPSGWAPNDGGPGNSGTHAYEGFKNRDLCWRCHFAEGQPMVASNESCSCHGLLGKMHGGEAWVQEHWKEATGVKSGRYSECSTCHTVDTLCVQCHPASYAEKYNPLPPSATDSYQRDIPYDPNYWNY